jgi:hypothetical protein
MKLRIAILSAILAVVGFAAWGQGTQIISTLTGTELVNIVSGPLSVQTTPDAINKYGRTHALTGTILSSSASVSVNPASADFFQLTPATILSLEASSAPTGVVAHIEILTSGTTSYTVSGGAKFKTTGSLTTGTTSGKIFMLTFVGDGTNMVEVARTTAQ